MYICAEVPLFMKKQDLVNNKEIVLDEWINDHNGRLVCIHTAESIMN